MNLSGYVRGTETARCEEGEVSEWLPIETAPKDRDILLTDGQAVCQGGWISDMDQGAEYEGQIGNAAWWSVSGLSNPTLWMPLPEPPK